MPTLERAPAYAATEHTGRCVADFLEAVRLDNRGSTAYYVFWSLPGVIFFSTYTLLVSEWARIFHHTYSSVKRKVSRVKVLIAVNVLFYLIQLGVWAMLLVSDPAVNEAYLTVQPYFLGIVAVLSAAFFLIYGIRLYLLFSRKLWKSNVKRRLVLSVFTVSAFCTVCFLARGIVNFVWVQDVKPLAPCTKAEFMVFFYMGVEVLPSLAVLFVMRGMPAAQSQTVRSMPNLPSNYDMGTSQAVLSSERSDTSMMVGHVDNVHDAHVGDDDDDMRGTYAAPGADPYDTGAPLSFAPDAHDYMVPTAGGGDPYGSDAGYGGRA